MANASPVLALLYSGGAGNSSPLSSLGGPASATPLKYIQSQSYTPSSIPGIEIAHASRNPEGDGYLSYTVANQLLTWTNPLGVVASVIVTGLEWAAVGSTTTGYLRLKIAQGSLPLTDTGQTVAVQQAEHTLFHLPAANELSSGLTDYRALYLLNQSGGRLVDVELVMTDQAPESAVYVGSTYNPLSRFATPANDGLDFRCIHHIGGVGPYSVSLSGKYHRERLISGTGIRTPSISYYPPDWGQESNGIDEDIEVSISGYTDSGGLLSSVDWGSSLLWGTIAPGKMVSFWVKREIPPGPAVPVVERVLFDISFTLS